MAGAPRSRSASSGSDGGRTEGRADGGHHRSGTVSVSLSGRGARECARTRRPGAGPGGAGGEADRGRRHRGAGLAVARHGRLNAPAGPVWTSGNAHGKSRRRWRRRDMMTLAGLLTFGAVYGAAVASPGPGVTAVVARVLARGLRGAPAFIAGFLVGDLIWFALAATTLHALVQTFAILFVVIRYVGAAYLLYLAWRLWTAPAAGEAVESRADQPLRLFLGGLSLTLGNPKVIFFFLALLPIVVDLGTLSVPGF